MANYLAMRIADGALNYAEVVAKFPKFKVDIDKILISHGHENLIKGDNN